MEKMEDEKKVVKVNFLKKSWKNEKKKKEKEKRAQTKCPYETRKMKWVLKNALYYMDKIYLQYDMTK